MSQLQLPILVLVEEMGFSICLSEEEENFSLWKDLNQDLDFKSDNKSEEVTADGINIYLQYKPLEGNPWRLVRRKNNRPVSMQLNIVTKLDLDVFVSVFKLE